MAVPVNKADTRVDDPESVELDLLLEAVYRYHGDDFRSYDRQALQRRLTAFLAATGVPNLSALQGQVLRNTAMHDALLRALTVHDHALFDAPAQWLALRELAGPLLRSYAAPKVWIAECTSAQEVFALAILLAEEGLYDKTTIYATASSEAVLLDVQAGRFGTNKLEEYSGNYRASGGKNELVDYCIDHGDGFAYAPRLFDNISWAHHSMAVDNAFNEFQLILCRHALADFGTLLQRRVLGLFGESLVQFGILMVDPATDFDQPPYSINYRKLPQHEGLYRRIG